MFVMNVIHSSTHQTHLRLTIYNKRAFSIQILISRDYSSPTSLLQILEIFPGNRQSSLRGPAPLCQLRSDKLVMCFTRKTRSYLRFAPPPPSGQNSFKQFPTPGPEGLDLSRGVPGGGMVTGKIEPCITNQERLI